MYCIQCGVGIYTTTTTDTCTSCQFRYTQPKEYYCSECGSKKVRQDSNCNFCATQLKDRIAFLEKTLLDIEDKIKIIIEAGIVYERRD